MKFFYFFYFFNDVAVAVPRHATAAAEFHGLGTPGNSQPSRKAKKHLMGRFLNFELLPNIQNNLD